MLRWAPPTHRIFGLFPAAGILAAALQRITVTRSAGMSRSPAIAAAALSLVTRHPLEDCLTSVLAGASHDVSPTLWSGVQMVYNEIAAN